MIEDKELARLFQAESDEHLARLDDGLLRLEKNPGDQPLLEELFREAHSLKGAARMLGLSRIETGAHGLETILNSARKGEAPLTLDAIERMNVVLAELRKLVQEVLGAAPSDTNTTMLLKELLPAPAEPDPVEPLREGAVDAATDAPVPVPNEKPPCIAPAGDETTSVVSPAEPELRKPDSVPAFRIETVRMETRKLDDLLTLVGELSVIQGRVQHKLHLMDALLDQWTMLERGSKKIRSMLREEKCGDKLRQALHAESESLTQLGVRLGEVHDALFDDGARLELTVNTLEEQVHSARLLPLSGVFALFPRMVRDLAREQGKEVELTIAGGEIAVDKRILEEMKDPLMHLLRNAVDHGIELPDEREQRGKARCGKIRLSAVRENGSVLLEVRDDGRGLDLDAIRHTAARRGLHDEATLAAMQPAQLQQMIFLPGFSTCSYVTELSGRGVGLDVVRVNVDRLKGNIRIETLPQQGLVIQVRLPLSLTTTRLLLAKVGERCYGVPIEFVETSLHLREGDIFSMGGHPTVMLDGTPLIAPRLADLLAQPAGIQALTACIVIRAGDEQVGLLVDDLLGEEEVVPKPLGAPLQRVRNVSALAILGSGDICVVLNPSDLVRSAHRPGATQAKSKPVQTGAKSSILLVEDSALVRAMEKRILEDAGYEVIAATDGADALDKLARHAFTAVVSDIMMPNMDGLTLTRRIREEPRYKDLPVILVTSLTSDEDKRRGLEVGANAYIPKPSFDQRMLLETLRRLI